MHFFRGIECRLLCIVLGLLVAMSASSSRIKLPDLGDPAESALSVVKEREIGNEIMLHIRQQRVIFDDLITQEYIESLGYKLLDQVDAAIHNFTFFVVGEKSINAFALPGGYIGVNGGLITATENESELAAVIAHEIAHVTQRHLARAFSHQRSTQSTLLAAALAAILIGGEVGRAALATASAGSVQSKINFTRKNEQEADRVGIDLLGRSGFDAYSMASLFGKMHRQSRLSGSIPPEFLSTHPMYSSRIADAKTRAGRYSENKHNDSREYLIVRARLKVLMEKNPQKIAVDLKRLLKEGQTANEQLDHYALALAALHSSQLQLAHEQIDKVLLMSPPHPMFNLLKAQIELASGHDQQAIERMQKLLLATPGNHILTLELARMLISVDQAAQAQELLEDYLVFRQGDPNVYELLSHASKADGDSMRSHAYMAQYHRLRGNLRQAVAHIESALKKPIGDYYQEARLRAQLKDLRAQQQGSRESPE